MKAFVVLSERRVFLVAEKPARQVVRELEQLGDSLDLLGLGTVEVEPQENAVIQLRRPSRPTSTSTSQPLAS
jgi:hypothetical protein